MELRAGQEVKEVKVCHAVENEIIRVTLISGFYSLCEPSTCTVSKCHGGTDDGWGLSWLRGSWFVWQGGNTWHPENSPSSAVGIYSNTVTALQIPTQRHAVQQAAGQDKVNTDTKASG